MRVTPLVRLAVVSLIVLFTLMPAPIFAAPPTFQTVPVDFVSILEPISTECGFPVQARLTGAFKVSTRVDKQGRIIIIERSVGLRFTFTNLESGTALASRNAGPSKTIINPDGSVTISVAGLFASIHFPQQGIILKDARRIVYDQRIDPANIIFEGGQHPLVEVADVSEFCAALT